MDINLPVLKKEGCFECVDNIDRISKLPDEILGKILSYLRTKNAVATSVLSKRWEHLWTLTSNLDFSDSSLIGCKDENDHMLKSRSFQSYVDSVIFHHGGLNIRKCWLFCYTISVSRVYSWICALIDCNVQELSLRCLITGMSGTYYQLPWRLFSCNTLVDLEIFEDFVLDVPKYVCFPRLKILNIHCALFVDDASMERLFSSCPVLENLTIMRRNDILEIMNIFVPSLKRLYVSCDSSPLQIKINTPRLEHLEIDAKCRYVANFTSSLVHANLFGLDIYLLNAISQVECLVLKANDESLRNIIRDSALPILKNLKTLNLEVAEESLSDWKVLPNLLDSSPNLQALIFPDGLLSINSREEDFNHFNWQRPESMPRCLSTSLKAIEIFEFVGFQEELELVEYLLECGEVLEKMIIHRFHISEHPRIKKSVEGDRTLSELLTLRRSCSHDEVMSFKRSCSTCEVIFTDGMICMLEQ